MIDRFCYLDRVRRDVSGPMFKSNLAHVLPPASADQLKPNIIGQN